MTKQNLCYDRSLFIMNILMALPHLEGRHSDVCISTPVIANAVKQSRGVKGLLIGLSSQDFIILDYHAGKPARNDGNARPRLCEEYTTKQSREEAHVIDNAVKENVIDLIPLLRRSETTAAIHSDILDYHAGKPARNDEKPNNRIINPKMGGVR